MSIKEASVMKKLILLGALALSACAPQGFSVASNAPTASREIASLNPAVEPGTEADRYNEAAPALRMRFPFRTPRMFQSFKLRASFRATSTSIRIT